MNNPLNTRSRKLSFLGFSNRVRSINHHQDDPENVLLDTEMEKVFDKASKSLSRTTSYNAQNDSEKFNVSHLTRDRNDVPIPMSSVNEDGGHSYEQQRKKFFIESAPTSAVWPVNDYSLEEGGGGGVGGGGGGGVGGYGINDVNRRNEHNLNDENKNDEPQERSPLISRRAEFSAGDHSDSSFDERRVQFNNQKYETNVSFQPQQQPTSPHGVGEENDRFEERKRRRSRHQYYRTRKLSHQEGSQRKVSESESTTGDHVQRKVSVQPEDFTLEEADINELISHRSDDQRGLRRPKIHSSMKLKKHSQNHSYLQQPDGSCTIGFKMYEPIIKKRFDHSPHEIFVQLDELYGSGKDREWKETARWIKYEEDLEEGSDRWGRPHVASLSFHSLINLRRCLETGVVLLDLEERDLPGVAYRVVEQMVIADLITADDKAIVMRALLLKHRHVNEHHLPHGFSFHKKKNCSTISLQTLNSQSLNTDDKRPRILPSNEINGNRSKNDLRADHKNDDFSIYSSSQEDLKKLMNDTIYRRIPQGAEATTVLVGSVEFLEKPTIAFIRLAEGILMPSITEVPIPVRFMFILMGPKLMDLDYHEVGRSIATLMANEHFHDIAYKADDRKELLSAINEFLDDSIVLPPGNWDRNDLLPFEELKAKRDWIKTRKAKALQMQDKIKQKELEEEAIKLLKSEGKVLIEKKKPRKGPLEKTNKLWGGLLNDIKRRYPMYKSDIFDGLNTETLAAAAFMFFANLSTAITFGGLMSEKTHNHIGISETLLACSIVGCIFHTFAGQPLVIIGTTGPLLLFDEALFQFCQSQDVEFLSVRFYIGIWLIIIGLTVSAFEGSVYVRLLTRFTQEIFSALITLIYIVETFMKLVIIYQRHPLSTSNYEKPSNELLPSAEAFIGNLEDYDDLSFGNFTELPLNVTNILHNITSNISNIPLMDNDRENRPRNQPNTALFCTFLTLGTFAVAYYLKLFRNSHFLGRNARRALGDFGVPIAIALFVSINYLIKGVYTEKLTVPEGLSPSLSGRDWLVSVDGVNEYIPFLAVIPAILVYILIFMETHISELIVDKPERGLKKGSGLHFDIVLLCFLNSICGSLGMPWHCAATVRSVAHVSAVTIMSRTHAPGESPRIIDVKEQRVSGLFVSIMVGLSVLMTPLLRLIPMAVLFGVFLYMGIASMTGVQLFERVTLYFMPTKHHPSTPYVNRLPTWKMHAFTTIQIFCLTVLWIVKSSIISLAFPFFLILMIPLRFQLSRFYTPKEMNALDGTQAKIEADDEPDFYEQAGIVA